MESRVVNVMRLGIRHQLALDQLRASITFTRLFSRILLDDGRRREVLDLNERIFEKCLYDQAFRGLHRELGVDPFDAVLVDGRLNRFVAVRYPQMTQLLMRRRAKDGRS